MGAVAEVFTGPKRPKPPPAPKPGPPPPTPVDPAVLEARRQSQAQARRRQGRASSILTSPQGLPSGQAFGGKTLLGE